MAKPGKWITKSIQTLLVMVTLSGLDQSGSLSFANAQCNIKYFMSFDDPDCSLLNKFDDHEAINAADGKCTSLGDGRAYKSKCDNETV